MNDPKVAAVQRVGGYWLSPRFEQLLNFHNAVLNRTVEIMVKGVGRKGRVKVAIAVINRNTTRSETVRPAPGHYLIAVSSELFIRLYESFAKVVRGSEFPTAVGRVTYQGPGAESWRTIATDRVGQAFPDLVDPDRCILLLGLVSCALEFLALHEFAHIKYGHMEVVDLKSKLDGISAGEFAASAIGASSLQRFELDADAYATERSLSFLRDFEFRKEARGGILLGLLTGLRFDEQIAAYECWLLCVYGLVVLMGDTSIRGPEDHNSSHPPWTYRFLSVLRRSREIGVAPLEYKDGASWDSVVVRVANWLEKADIPAKEFLWAIEEYKKRPYENVIEISLRNDIVDTFLAEANILEHVHRIKEYREIKKALEQLQVYLMLVHGTLEQIAHSQDVINMHQSAAFKTLVSSAAFGRAIRGNLPRLLKISADYRIGLIVLEVAREIGLDLQGQEWPPS
jgi:hypothetical protein